MMIEQTRFLMMPLETKTQRRRFVVVYALLLSVLVLPSLVRSRWLPMVMLLQSFTIAGLLGGIRAGGPVKPFAEPGVLNAGGPDREMVSLDLNRRATSAWTPLDERERAERDHAHYTAYRILRWVLGGAAAIFFAGAHTASGWFLHNAPTLLWILLMIVLSLPQCVILWTDGLWTDGPSTDAEAA